MLANLDVRNYKLVSLESDVRAFEQLMWTIYNGETTSSGSPFVVSNLLLDDVDELSEYLSSVMLRDAVQVEGTSDLQRTFQNVFDKPSPERTLRYMEFAMKDVVAFLLNHSLPFIYIEYKDQGVRKRWVRMAQREVW